MLGYQGVAVFERVRSSGLDGGSVSTGMGFEFSEAQSRPGVSLFLLPVDPDGELSDISLASRRLSAATFPAVLTMA